MRPRSNPKFGRGLLLFWRYVPSSVFLAILPELRQGRLDLTIEPPDDPTIDHLDAIDAGDPEVAVLLDSDPRIVGGPKDAG